MWKILNVTHEEWMCRHIKFSTVFLYKTKEVARIMLDCEIVAIWHTILLDFTCSLDIMEKVISKRFFILYFVSNLLIFSISHSGNILYVQFD